MKWKNSKVAVLLGGPSSEREVSLKSGAACAGALREKGYDVVEIDMGADLAERLKSEKVDVAFNILHGKWGEDGCVQGLLELLRIPYTGAGVLGSAVAMSKIASKALMAAAGLPVAPHRVLTRASDLLREANAFPPPWVVKPAAEGSSVGVSILKDAAGLQDAVEKAFRWDARVLLEPYLPGREIQVGVLAGRALGIVEVKPRPVPGEAFTFYDYAHKYTKGMTDYITRPEGLDGAKIRAAEELGTAACAALEAEGVARVDLILKSDGAFVVLEVNTLPGMTELSLLPMIARDWAGIGYADLVEQILETASLKVGF